MLLLLLLLLLLLRVAPLLSCGSSEPHDRQGDGEQENLERKSIREQRQRGADAEQQQQQQQPRCLPADPSGPTARKKRAKREKETKQVAIAELLLPTTAAAAALERALAECGRRVRCCRSRKPRLFVSAFVAFFFSLREGSFRFSFAPFRNATGLAPSELAGQSAQQKNRTSLWAQSLRGGPAHRIPGQAETDEVKTSKSLPETQHPIRPA